MDIGLTNYSQMVDSNHVFVRFFKVSKKETKFLLIISTI